MGKIAFLFAGQGAQYAGMGASLEKCSPAAQKVFATAESIRPGTKKQCFSGSDEELRETRNTQPCVFTVALAAAQALQENGVIPQACAGFSLGEVSALTFAGAFTLEEGMRLVCRRGERMQEASEKHPGAMAAVLKLSNEEVEKICLSFSEIWPVNYNCPGQLVVAGNPSQMPQFCQAVEAAGGKARPLAVGGGFHTPYMKEASEEFLRLLKSGAFSMQAPSIPVYSNTTASFYPEEENSGANREELLAGQMQNPVRWQEIMEKLFAEGFDCFIEVGPGKTLTGFGKRIFKEHPNVKLLHVEDEESLHKTLEALAEENN